MYRAAARRVCRCHGRDRDEAQQPPPRCWLPHLATATGVGWLRSFWFSTPPARAPGVSRCAQVFGDEDPGIQDRRPQERGQTRLNPLIDVGRYRRRCCRSGRTWARTGIGDSRRDAVERSAQPLLLLLTGTGVDLKHGSTADQGRTGREDSSSRLWRPARALGTHAKRGPSTGHSAVGLRQAGNSLLTPRPHFTAPSCTLGNQVVDASDGPPISSGAPSDSYMPKPPGPVAVCSPKRAHCELGDRVLGWRPHR